MDMDWKLVLDEMVGSVNVDTAKMDRIVVVQTTHFIQLGVIQP